MYIAGGFLASATLAAANSWNTNGGRRDLAEPENTPMVERAEGAFAYVLGVWPAFYVYNGLVPASDVISPWALPGAPGNWFFTPPAPDSFRGRMLSYVQNRSLPRLFDDFARTPPSYILVLDVMARHGTSGRVTDVPGFDAYLSTHCAYARSITDDKRGLARLYRCNPALGEALATSTNR